MSTRIAVLISFLSLSMLNAQSSPWGSVPKEQVAALVQFFESTGGKNWKDNSGWGGPISPCEWFGISCNIKYVDGKPQSSVVGISLMDNGLKGSFSSSVSKLPDLKFLNLALNKLSGEVPEEILTRWDNHQFEFRGDGNSFSNFVIRARMEYTATSVQCSNDEDLRYVLDVREWGLSRFESIRCTPNSKRDTYCLIREGKGFSLDRFSRALTQMHYRSLQKEYSYPFTFATEGVVIRTTVWWGDGSMQTVETYDRQGPIEVWIAQELFMALIKNSRWERESTKPSCEEIK